MLFNEPKLLKSWLERSVIPALRSFSALQRAEIAEIGGYAWANTYEVQGFSALQRAEIAEIDCADVRKIMNASFSALQRAEIAEIALEQVVSDPRSDVSVLFNEPKLLKSGRIVRTYPPLVTFQCSSTSRNC